jgi:hypothetical protein
LQVPSSKVHGQVVSAPGKTQVAALPLQDAPQTPLPEQAPRWPWGVSPEGMGEHVPRWPETSQAWH